MLLAVLPAEGIRASSPQQQLRSIFSIYDNADNAHLRHGTAGVTDLGEQPSASACEKACIVRLGADPTEGCTSFTFYHQDYSLKEEPLTPTLTLYDIETDRHLR